MAGPAQALDLPGSLAILEAVLDVACGIPGTITRDMNSPFMFPQVGPSGEALPDLSLSTNALAKLEWKIVSVVGLGFEEQREEYDPLLVIPGDTYEPDPLDPLARLGGVVTTVSGNRVIHVQVKCEAHAPGGGGAFMFLEKCRTRLCLPSVIDTLEAAGFAIADVSDARCVDFTDPNGRLVSAALFELTVNAADAASDDPVTTIETVEPDYSDLGG